MTLRQRWASWLRNALLLDVRNKMMYKFWGIAKVREKNFVKVVVFLFLFWRGEGSVKNLVAILLAEYTLMNKKCKGAKF